MQKTILIIEDEPDIQDILSAFLSEAGYKVLSAFDGVKGISMFRAQNPDLILLDIMLPRMNGYSVLEMLRLESDIPVIVLTAMDDEADQINGFDLKADDYITKPFSTRLLLKRVEAVLRRACMQSLVRQAAERRRCSPCSAVWTALKAAMSCSMERTLN